ncbi:MAG: hypothetical protein AB7I30_09515, partial [Isosphaeraceae bacterium]
MTIRQSVTVAFSLATVVGVTAALAQKPIEPTESRRGKPGARALNDGQRTIRLTLGVGDGSSNPWSGRVTLSEGSLVAVEGQRFREGDATVGDDGWKARSLPIRKAAAKKAAAKKASTAPTTGPGTVGAMITPTIVDVTVLAPTSATLRVTTEQGDFDVPLNDTIDGKPLSRLNGRVSAQLIPTAVPLVADTTDDDFPSAVLGSDGSAWVVYVAHTPFGPDALSAFEERPRDFS